MQRICMFLYILYITINSRRTLMNELDKTIQQYLDRGFGSMNKNDFEVWIFNYLLQNRLKGLSNYDISIELKIPESKVKRLKYEAGLKYGDTKDTAIYASELEVLLNKAQLKKNGLCVQFVIEDIQLRKYLDSLLKQDGRFSDTSFNTEIVSIDADDLGFLMKTIFPSKDWKEFEKKAKKLLDTDNVTFKGLFKKFAESAAVQAGKRTFDLTFAGIMALL